MLPNTPHGAFKAASKYTEESLQNYGHLVKFIRRRQAIEDEYARSLRKLCKSISLIPHRKRQERNKLKSGNSLISWLFPCTNPNVVMDFGDQKSENELMYEDGASEGTAIWRTFFEIVDDTAQIAKSHSAFAESLKTQLGDPLKTALHEMETEKKTIVGEGQQAARELEKSGNALLKARSRYDSCALEAVRLRDAASLAVSAAQRNGNSIEENKMVNREKMLLEKAKIAEDAIVVARKALKAAEEAHRQTHSRHHATDLPRVMAKLQHQESLRNKSALENLHKMVELEKRCAHMDEGFGCEMSGRLRDVDLSMDEHGFVRAFLSVPLPPPPVPHLPPSGAASVMFGIQPANAESRTNPFHNSTGNMLINNGSDGCILDASDVPRQSHQHHCKTASGMMPPAYDSPVSMRGGGMTPPRRSGTVSLGDLLYSSSVLSKT